jgi:hypothetical protein
MAFKEVQSLEADTTISLGGFNKKTRTDNPTTITGYFLGSRKVASPKAKTGWSALHVFQTAEGNVGVWGKTDLDRKLTALATQLGVLVRVTQSGFKPTKNGNDMYLFRVEVDADDRIEVDLPQTLETQSTEEDYSDDEEYTQDEEPTYTTKASPVVDSARQAKVKNLLNKTKTATA